MLRQMLAADELYPEDLDKLRATGFLARNWVLFNRNQWLDNVVEHVSKGLLGLTMNCAKCHEHKYDPIEQRDYFAMRAFFEPYHVRVDVVPGQPDLAVDGIPRVFDGLPEEPTYLFVLGQENRPDKTSSIAPRVPDVLEFADVVIEPVPLPLSAWQPERRPWVIGDLIAGAASEVDAAKAALREFEAHESDRSGAPDASAERRVAEAALELARAKKIRLERRAEALRASEPGRKPRSNQVIDAPEGAEREAAAAAVRAERQVAVAEAAKQVADAELALLRAKSAKARTAAEAELKKARESMAGARKRASSPVRGRDRYTRLSGAKWTPTRFVRSTKDDPEVRFVPRSTGRRTALARWITDRRHPLTARVAANHVWTRHMGEPIVASVFDFGHNGRRPSHPELLDWLAAELIESGWSLKHLHRCIVTSATYRRSSSTSDAESQRRPRSRQHLLVAADTDPPRVASRARLDPGSRRNPRPDARRTVRPTVATAHLDSPESLLLPLRQRPESVPHRVRRGSREGVLPATGEHRAAAGTGVDQQPTGPGRCPPDSEATRRRRRRPERSGVRATRFLRSARNHGER